MQSTWETHKGKKIFYADYSNLSLEQFRDEVAAVEKEMVHSPEKSVLLLVNITGIIISPEILSLANNVAKISNKYVRKTAILGVTGARRTIIDIVVKFSGMSVIPFAEIQQAKDWLVSD